MAPRSYRVSATPFVIFAQLITIAVITLVLVWLLHFQKGFSFKSDERSKLFNLHPFLMVIGLIVIGGQAIMAYKSIPAKRKTRKGVHLVLHLTAFLSGILGIYVIFKYKKEEGAQNFLTLHSWLGITTVSLYGLQFVLGFLAYFFPGAEWTARATLLPWHIFVGMVIFFFAMVNAEIGLSGFSQTVSSFSERYIVNFTGLLILLYAISVTFVVILPGRY
ncbi:probable ascorbate-specific transmembrane electron transporter 1 [Quercus robur]|uniref:probable ascorbate-specific transmembrane electron transporter 1 n=1 Tax=Quercus robur TaxID=38942 RepID=UPI002163B2B2|nr:probable ascorbate-specific transmembrane electron transporter 1 [Quercus robur]